MQEKIYNDISGAIATLAQKLGVAAEHVYATLIRQQVTEGIYSIVVISLCIIGLLFVVKLIKFGLKASRDGEEEASIFIWIISLVLALIALCILFTFSSDVMKLFNPEYYAIQEVIEMIK
jgi:Na+-driven multidrug efflux pump